MKLIKICPVCAGALDIKLIPYRFRNIYFGEFEAEVCEQCKAVYYADESYKKIRLMALKKGLLHYFLRQLQIS